MTKQTEAWLVEKAEDVVELLRNLNDDERKFFFEYIDSEFCVRCGQVHTCMCGVSV